MIQIREIDHIVLRVTNLEAMLGFYCDILGCKVERRQEELGLTQLRAGRSLIDLVTVESELGRRGGSPPGPDGRNMDHLCLRLEPFDAEVIYAHLNRHCLKAEEVRSRYGAEGEGPSIYLSDPEGNVIELKGAPW
jgi:glyoxylase I family protein